MKKGCLIVNDFLNSEKFFEQYQALVEAGKKYDIDLEIVKNSEMMSVFGLGSNVDIDLRIAKYDFIYNYDKDLSCGKAIDLACEKLKIPVFNSIWSIEICDDKIKTYEHFEIWNSENASASYSVMTNPNNPDEIIKGHREENTNRIPMIASIAAPMTYSNIAYNDFSFVDYIIEKLSLPIVIKEACGSFGSQVYLAKSKEEVIEISKNLSGKRFLFQKFVENSKGIDIRLQVVGGQVVAGMKRRAKSGDFRANLTNGGSMENYYPKKEEVDLALKVCEALGLDFAGVDLLFSKGEENCADLVCEVNSNAHFTNISKCTGVNIAEKVMEYIREILINN